jgi:hypothetical protein
MNEGRFGYRVNGTNVIAPWDIPENDASINAYLPAPVNGFKILTDTHRRVRDLQPYHWREASGELPGRRRERCQHHGDRQGHHAQLDLRRHS